MPANTPLICSFESRRSEEMRSLIERFGGIAVIAPSMQEVPVDSNTAAVAAIENIISGEVSNLILLTGVGTEAMLKVASCCGLENQLLTAMKALPLLVRGPKPAAVISKLGLKYTVKAAEPNTYKELLEAIDTADIDLNGDTVAVQEYGVPNPELYAGLKERGAHVFPVPVYRWALPDNIEPLRGAIRSTIDGEFNALMFTSAQQIRHLLEVADRMGLRSEWLSAANRITIASIGPTCSEALLDAGLSVSFEASPPKMGPLARGVMEQILANSNKRDVDSI